jgi:hypothetical protein
MGEFLFAQRNRVSNGHERKSLTENHESNVGPISQESPSRRPVFQVTFLPEKNRIQNEQWGSDRRKDDAPFLFVLGDEKRIPSRGFIHLSMNRGWNVTEDILLTLIVRDRFNKETDRRKSSKTSKFATWRTEKRQNLGWLRHVRVILLFNDILCKKAVES